MQPSILESQPELFPLFFLCLWFVVTTLLGLLSGWYALMRAFPDRDEAPLQRLVWLSGKMGIVSMRSVLTIAVCPSGLRITIFRLLGPFCRPIFVPWEQIQVGRERHFLMGDMAALRFGGWHGASLLLRAEVADRLARASNGNWPEAGVLPAPDKSRLRATILRQWALSTFAASMFFIFAPRLLAPDAAGFPPVAVAILFPAIVFGIAAVVRYCRSSKT